MSDCIHLLTWRSRDVLHPSAETLRTLELLRDCRQALQRLGLLSETDRAAYDALCGREARPS